MSEFCVTLPNAMLTTKLHFCNLEKVPNVASAEWRKSQHGRMHMKILVVEDEIKTGDYLRQWLAEAGFVVDLARDGLDGLHLALSP